MVWADFGVLPLSPLSGLAGARGSPWPDQCRVSQLSPWLVLESPSPVDCEASSGLTATVVSLRGSRRHTVRSAMATFGGEPNFLAPAFPLPRFVGVLCVLELELAACFTLPTAVPSLTPNASEPPCHLRLRVRVHVAKHIPWFLVSRSVIYCSASPPGSCSSSLFGLR
jgi:hypothetical protein